jgi:hypothetical protein
MIEILLILGIDGCGPDPTPPSLPLKKTHSHLHKTSSVSRKKEDAAAFDLKTQAERMRFDEEARRRYCHQTF